MSFARAHLFFSLGLLLWTGGPAVAAEQLGRARLGERRLAIRVAAMPAHNNSHGNIFGGWLLSQMDQAANLTAKRWAGGRVATVAMDEMTFKKPVRQGQKLSLYTTIERVGRSSMTIKVEAFKRDPNAGVDEKVTEGTFTLVALNLFGRPRPAPLADGEGNPRRGLLDRLLAYVHRPRVGAAERRARAEREARERANPPLLPAAEPAVHLPVTAQDVDARGKALGGWILSQMDLAAGGVAQSRAGGRAVTVGVTGMSFEHPVRVEDEVSLFSKVVKTGSTSLTVDVEAWRTTPGKSRPVRVTKGTFTFVAVDEHGAKRALPAEASLPSPAE